MRSEITQNNYLYVPGFIDPDEARLLEKEFKAYARDMNLRGDPQAPNSSVVYDFLPFVRLLVEKVTETSALLGDKVLPTYTYARIYKHGSMLERHRDRPACEISFTLNLGKDTNWPIWFQRPDGSETSVELNPGDAVMYLGCQADHWRESFGGQEYTQVFMHYVRSYGPKAWAYFDKRQQQIPTPQSDNLPVTVL